MVVIDVDFDVWKALTAQRKSEHDTYSNVVRRALGMKELPTPKAPANRPSARPWIAQGVEFPDGSEFMLPYKGKQHSARVVNGALQLEDGRRFDSPSRAARAITRTNVNGWVSWLCRMPGHANWARMDSFRGRGTI